MGFIFLDESGNMGFDFTKSRTSQYCIITCLFVANKRLAKKIIRQVVKRLSPKERRRYNKFFKSPFTRLENIELVLGTRAVFYA